MREKRIYLIGIVIILFLFAGYIVVMFNEKSSVSRRRSALVRERFQLAESIKKDLKKFSEENNITDIESIVKNRRLFSTPFFQSELAYYQLLDPEVRLLFHSGLPYVKRISPVISEDARKITYQSLRIDYPKKGNSYGDYLIPILNKDYLLGYLRIGFLEEHQEKTVVRTRDIFIPVLIGTLIIVFSFVYTLWLLKRVGQLESEIGRKNRLAYLGEVASGLAHEIRNPLNTIGMNLQLIDEEIKSTDEQFRKRFERVKGELERLDTILSGFLRFTRPPKLSIERTDINELVNKTVRFFQPECISKGITLELSLADGLPRIFVDGKQVEQMLLNLLTNARDATRRGGRIKVTTQKIRQGVRIIVEDTGCGIPKEKLTEVFKPYFTTKQGGTGIGLSIVKRIAEEHSARIQVESTLGKGTRFIVEFPK